MSRLATIGRFIQIVVLLGVLTEFIDGGTRHFHRCHDCPTRHGWPFSYYQDPSRWSAGGWIWQGLLGDLLLVCGLAALLTWRRSGRAKPPAPTPGS